MRQLLRIGDEFFSLEGTVLLLLAKKICLIKKYKIAVSLHRLHNCLHVPRVCEIPCVDEWLGVGAAVAEADRAAALGPGIQVKTLPLRMSGKFFFKKEVHFLFAISLARIPTSEK